MKDKSCTATFTEVAEMKKSADANRARAEDLARSAVVELRGIVMRALGGERLTGLPNLGNGSRALHGINVRAKSQEKRLYYGQPALVIDRFGDLVIVDYGPEKIVARGVERQEIQAEDLRKVVDGYHLAATKHLARCTEIERQSSDLGRLADCIADALLEYDDEAAGHDDGGLFFLLGRA